MARAALIFEDKKGRAGDINVQLGEFAGFWRSELAFEIPDRHKHLVTVKALQEGHELLLLADEGEADGEFE